jgi:chemotaxis-related protein WspD
MTTDSPDISTAQDCWNRIGIAGDRSCPELVQVIHCRNCPVYARAARTFFERQAPDGYLEEWTRLLGEPDIPPQNDDVSVLIFRLGREWLALRTRVIVEVTSPRPVHHIPHRSGATLVGMVNLRGQLHLLISLHGLLGAENGDAAEHEPSAAGRRLVVMSQGGQTWVFAAEEVRGVVRFSREHMSTVPSNLANPSYSFSQAVILSEGHSIGFLDDQRVFAALRGIGQ